MLVDAAILLFFCSRLYPSWVWAASLPPSGVQYQWCEFAVVLVQNGNVSDSVLPQHHLSTSRAHSSPLEFRADLLGCEGGAHIITGGFVVLRGVWNYRSRLFGGSFFIIIWNQICPIPQLLKLENNEVLTPDALLELQKFKRLITFPPNFVSSFWDWNLLLELLLCAEPEPQAGLYSRLWTLSNKDL